VEERRHRLSQPANWTNGFPTDIKAAVVNKSGQIATVMDANQVGVQKAETLLIDNGGHVRVDKGGNLQ